MKITGLQAIYHNFVPRPPAKNGKGSPEKESMRRALDRKCPNRAYHLLPRKLQQSETMEFCSFLRFLFALKGESGYSISMNTLMIFPREWRDSL